MSEEITRREKRDLVLPPGSFVLMQDTTKGVIKVYTGPTVVNPTAQEVPVVYDVSIGTFRRVSALEDAMCISTVAPEGYYIVLDNPAKQNVHPQEGTTQASADLEIGRTINVPGPATFALWPGQVASVVEGHHLRSNQYLLVRVYNEDEAKKNWGAAIIKPASGDGDVTSSTPAIPPPDLTVGKQLIIRGTEVSFYIPPTGIEVVNEPVTVESNSGSSISYVREALTLERLEYCILVDENGKKRYEIGPQVVFPTPSERFVEAKGDSGSMSRKFRAVELNEIQGLHIKVIADYEEGGKKHKAGDELFITGAETAIYYPREEHSAIKYDGKVKHFATAVPAGEARYVMDRLSGEIQMERGPAMLLPDPRTKVIVRRVLSDKQASLWYPGNAEVLAYNQTLRSLLTNVPTTRQGAISEGEVQRSAVNLSRKSLSADSITRGQHQLLASNAMVMESSRVSGDQGLVAEEFSRASTYTQPRTVTLDTKYQGAPAIDVWTGYSVMVVSKTGKRRVERGPATLLLEYDERLEVLELSTGKPKTTDVLLKTVYLRVDNNKVSDIFEVETSDHVRLEFKLSYRVNFEGESNKWFAVENYVKFLCDHVRSVLRGQVRKLKVEEFYTQATDYIRDILLGKVTAESKQRPGMAFHENGMRVVDVEVLGVVLKDEKIRLLLDNTQHDVVKSSIELSTLRRNLELTKQREAVTQEEATIKTMTQTKMHELERELAASSLSVTLTKIGGILRETEEKRKNIVAEQETQEVQLTARLDRVKREKDQEFAFFSRDQERQIELLKAEAEAAVQRFTAASGNFSEALLALSSNETLVKVATAWNTQKIIEGEGLGDTLQRLFHNTPLKTIVDKLASNGKGSLVSSSTSPVA